MADREHPNEHEANVDEGQGRLLVRTWSDGEAAVIRQLLSSYDIPCQVVSDVPHSVLPLSVDGLGEIRILVSAGQVEEARRILAEHLRNGLELLEGGKARDESSDGPLNGPRGGS